VIDCFFAIPGDLDTPTGGYAYDREVLRRLGKHGIACYLYPLPAGFPNPSPEERAETKRRIAPGCLPDEGPAPVTDLHPGAVILADGLAYGALDADTLDALSCPVVALVHHPLAYETGTSPERAAELLASERAALARASAVVVTSTATADLLAAEYGVERAAITVAVPGVAPAARAVGSGGPRLRLLAVGAVSPRKGYGVLIEALAMLRDLEVELVIVGATDRNAAEVGRLREAIARHGLGGRVVLTGAVDETALAEAYASADIFVMPSLFEGYGMVITEALARGLPIVSTTGGALGRVVPDEAALKVPPADAPALAEALRRMATDQTLRSDKAEAAWRLAHALPRWDDTARIVAEVIERVAPMDTDDAFERAFPEPEESFSADWLLLREPADHAARSPVVAETVRAHFAGRDSVDVIDMGCGAGSNLRGTAHLLPKRQRWGLLDYDRALLGAAKEALAAWADTSVFHIDVENDGLHTLRLVKDGRHIDVNVAVADLAKGGAAMVHPKADLVTAAALFDLASPAWIEAFVAEIASRGQAFLTTLTYDGRDRFDPPHPLDAAMLAAFHADMRRDKGFGPAAGPDATRLLAEAFAAKGYRVVTGDSPWVLDASSPLARSLAEGFAAAVEATGKVPADAVRNWLAFRLAAKTWETGHADLFAVPG
jgi:glycosyltransferase involved in cell wall biosynthesis